MQIDGGEHFFIVSSLGADWRRRTFFYYEQIGSGEQFFIVSSLGADWQRRTMLFTFAHCQRRESAHMSRVAAQSVAEKCRKNNVRREPGANIRLRHTSRRGVIGPSFR